MKKVWLLGRLFYVSLFTVGSLFISSSGQAPYSHNAQAKPAAMSSKSMEVTRIYIKPVHDGYAADPKHGDVYVVYAGGQQKKVTTNGLCFDPKRAPDRKTIGWVVGEPHTYRDMGNALFPAQIVCYRAGRKISTLKPEKIFSVHWEFQKEGRHIAVSCQGSHGPIHLQLFDTHTGKLIDKCMSYDEKKPAWAKGLPTL